MVEHYRYQPSDPGLKALLGRMYGETGMGAASQSEKNAAEVQSILTEKMVRAIDAHADELKAATENVLMGMQRHAKALTDAADASTRYARGLVWATGALVLATIALIVVTWYRG